MYKILLVLGAIILLVHCKSKYRKVKINHNGLTWIYYVDSDSLKQGASILYVTALGEDSGVIERSNFKNDLLNEQTRLYFKSNFRLKNTINYRNGVLNGEYVRFDENGNIILKCYYKNGLKDSLFTVYTGNGILGFTNYNEGQKNGLSVLFKPNTNDTLKVEKFENDKLMEYRLKDTIIKDVGIVKSGNGSIYIASKNLTYLYDGGLVIDSIMGNFVE